MQSDRANKHPSAKQRASEQQLSLSDLIPAALASAGVFIGPLVAHAPLIRILAGCAGAATFFGGSLVVLGKFGTSLAPAVLASAVSGATGGLVYWLLGRPDLTAIGTAGLGAIGGAAIAPFELIWVQFRHEMAQLEADSDFEYTGLIPIVWSALAAVLRHWREQQRGRIEQ